MTEQLDTRPRTIVVREVTADPPGRYRCEWQRDDDAAWPTEVPLTMHHLVTVPPSAPGAVGDGACTWCGQTRPLYGHVQRVVGYDYADPPDPSPFGSIRAADLPRSPSPPGASHAVLLCPRCWSGKPTIVLSVDDADDLDPA